MTTQQIIGENLAKLRERRGLTRGDIAEGVGVTNQAVAAWELGKRCPSVDLLMKICELLSVTPNDLVYNDLVYEESSRVSSREKKEPVLRVQKRQCPPYSGREMPVLQHRSPLQGKYKEVQPLLPLLRAGFAVVKEEEMNILENLNANDAAKYVVDVSDTISNFYKTIHSIADKYGIDRDDVMKHALRVFSNMIELGTLFEKMGQTAEWER